jgi:hypothetical protein
MSGYRVVSIFPIVKYCDVLPGNASVISGFWILYSDLFVNFLTALESIYIKMYVCTGISIFRWMWQFHFALLLDSMSIRRFPTPWEGPSYVNGYSFERSPHVILVHSAPIPGPRAATGCTNVALPAPFLNIRSFLKPVESLSNLIQGFVNTHVTSWRSIM